MQREGDVEENLSEPQMNTDNTGLKWDKTRMNADEKDLKEIT